MKAFVYQKYGSPDILELQELEKPVPDDDQLLVRVRAASVNPADWHFLTGAPFIVRIETGLRGPKTTRLGADLAGQVEAAGKNMTQFQPGDEVFGTRRGAFGEYVLASDKTALVPKPANLTFEQAAAVPIAACTALQGLRDHGHMQPGQRVLINGASGGVGTFAVQIAKAFGAEVTAVCSPRNVEMVRGLGADRVIDYTREDFTRSGERYDLLLDNAGNHSLSACRRVLGPTGIHVIVAAPVRRMLQALLGARLFGQKVVPFIASVTKADLLTLKDLIEAGKITPVIDRRYTLSEVPDALRYLGEGHARAKLVVTVATD